MRSWIQAGLGLMSLLLLTGTGCKASSEVLTGGTAITPEQLQEISAAIFSAPDEPDSKADAETSALLGAWDSEVYWLAGGKVLHTDPDCSYIRGKDGVQHGGVQDAANAGKTELCSACRRRAEQTESPSEPPTEPEGSTP